MGHQPDSTSDECRLCGAEAKLRLSHIVPRWAFRRLVRMQPPDSPASPVRVENGVAVYDPRQSSERMLCHDCEQRIGIDENYVASIVMQEDNTFPARDTAARHILSADGRYAVCDAGSLDVDRMGYFALSVIWRASVSRQDEYASVNLGLVYSELFSDFLLGRGPFPTRTQVVAEVFSKDVRPGVESRPRRDRMVIPPFGHKQQGYHVHSFCTFGMRFYVLVGGRIPADVEDVYLIGKRRLLLSHGDDFLRTVARGVHGSVAKGKLGTRVAAQ